MNRFALSFKGGVARGLASVGILRFFQEENIEPYIYAGSSSGAIVAATAAMGMSWKESLDLFCNIKFLSVCSVHSVLFKHSLVDHDKYYREYIRVTEGKNIEDLSKKLVIFATDADHSTRVILQNGNIAKALVATSAFPFIFPEEYIEGRKIIDGDLTSSYSTTLLKEMGAKKVIGVGHVREKYKSKNSIFGKINDIYVPMSIQLQKLNNIIDPPDFEINYDMSGHGIFQFKDLHIAAERAYQKTKKHEKEIFKLLNID